MTVSEESAWITSHETLLNVASYAIHELGQLTTAEEVFSFFEKPWKYPELYQAYSEWTP